MVGSAHVEHIVQRALIVVDHGSRRAEANAALVETARMVAERVGESWGVRYAHMELGEPSLEQAVTRAVADGAREIVVVPFFLAPGNHAKVDIPASVEAARAAHPAVRFRLTDVLGPDVLLAELVLKRCGIG
ncbi:MAG: CbiX/SirB N-terminal domain-containing protein [Polyangiaceae bacterium]